MEVMSFLENWAVSKGFVRISPRELKVYLKSAYIFQTSEYSKVILEEKFLGQWWEQLSLVELLSVSEELLVTKVPLHAAIPSSWSVLSLSWPHTGQEKRKYSDNSV